MLKNCVVKLFAAMCWVCIIERWRVPAQTESTQAVEANNKQELHIHVQRHDESEILNITPALLSAFTIGQVTDDSTRKSQFLLKI